MTETDISAIWADSLLLELYMYRQNQHRSTGGWYVLLICSKPSWYWYSPPLLCKCFTKP